METIEQRLERIAIPPPEKKRAYPKRRLSGCRISMPTTPNLNKKLLTLGQGEFIGSNRTMFIHPVIGTTILIQKPIYKA